MIVEEEAYLAHYGILRKSGRYPWGSGETQSERNRSFLDTIENLRKEGMSDPDIAKAFSSPEQPFTTTDLRALKSIAVNQQKLENIARAQQLKDKGLSNVAIGEKMGINESSVRNLLAPGAAERADILHQTSEMLKRSIDEKGFIDIGGGVENQLGISSVRLSTAVAMLKEEGYQVYYPKVSQLGTGKDTSRKLLGKGDMSKQEAYAAIAKMDLEGKSTLIVEHSPDMGRTFFSNQPPLAVSPSRVGITYKEDGGAKADGVIYVRPGVPDISLGNSRYAQVRIQVGDGHYLKGMAIYKDDLPKGVDLMFNTNKSDTGNKLDALKELKRVKDTGEVDKENPFGAITRQLPKLDANGREIPGTVRSAMNIVNDEGKWDEWSRTLSTQFLSKQSPELARQQLAVTYEKRRQELDEIMSLTNPAVRKKLLESYADNTDSSAYKLKAQALPRQRTQVILPISTLKDNEVYAPNFTPGERVVLVRHPHGGKFEIPELVVTDKNPEARNILGFGANASKDAIGINSKVAERLSGADFDGDTVLVIPNNAGKIKTEKALEGLKNFDPQQYKLPPDAPKIKSQTKQKQMGLVSNLITDMTIKGASNNELAAAVRHSMVVIDAEKHHLDYKRSARENNIAALTAKYQAKPDKKNDGGATTLISRAKQDVYVDARRAARANEGGPIDRNTGQLKFVATGETRVNNKGQIVKVQTKTNGLLETKSARELSSGTTIENIYADHSDRLRALANEARKEYVNTKPTPMSDSAKKTYAAEVVSLNAKLNVALQNRPRERQAQVVANSIVAAKKQQYPDMDKSDLKKIKAQALATARIRTGAHKELIGSKDTPLTDREWAAIQAGAISNNKLEQILNNADLDRVKELATPRTATVMTSAKQARAKSMLSSGYSPADVANALGVSVSTLRSSVIE